MTVYIPKNYWVFGLFHCPVFQELENTTPRKLALFASSGEGGKTPTQLGPLEALERANLNHWGTDETLS
jgi:hypothetical protein